VTPLQATGTLQQNVQTLVVAGALLPADGNSLESKLNDAFSQISKGHGNAAISDLKDFISQTLAVIHNRRLTSARGQPLIDTAGDIITALGG
jgi:hypothetical protein